MRTIVLGFALAFLPATPMPDINFAELLDEVQIYAKDLTGKEHPELLLRRKMQHSYEKIYDDLARGNPSLFRTTTTITFVADQQEYDLPDDFMLARAVRRTGGVSRTYEIGIASLGSKDHPGRSRWPYPDTQVIDDDNSGTPTHCYIDGDKIGFIPKPSSAVTDAVTLEYIPWAPKIGEQKWGEDPSTGPMRIEDDNTQTQDGDDDLTPTNTSGSGWEAQFGTSGILSLWTTDEWTARPVEIAVWGDYGYRIDGHNKDGLSAAQFDEFLIGITITPSDGDYGQWTHITFAVNIADQTTLDIVQASGGNLELRLWDGSNYFRYRATTADLALGWNTFIVKISDMTAVTVLGDPPNIGEIGSVTISIRTTDRTTHEDKWMRAIFDGYGVFFDPTGEISTTQLTGSKKPEEYWGIWLGTITSPQYPGMGEWLVYETAMRLDDIVEGRGVSRMRLAGRRDEIRDNVRRLLNRRQSQQSPRIRPYRAARRR